MVVKKDDDIVCYHFYNRNDIEDYLYNNTKFERGGRNKHHFGSLYRGEDGEVYIKLNLQIRFTKWIMNTDKNLNKISATIRKAHQNTLQW